MRNELTPTALHLCIHQTSPVVASPFLTYDMSQPVTCFGHFVARARPQQSRFSRSAVFAWGYHRLRASVGNRCMARLGVTGALSADADQSFNERYVSQPLWQHGRFAQSVVRHLNGSNLQCVGINAQVHLASLPPVLGPVLLTLPFTLAQELDIRAFHQQVQRSDAGSVGQLHSQCLLMPAQGAEVGHSLFKSRPA